MKLICGYCGRDINEIGQDNMSYNDMPMCEDCDSSMNDDDMGED